MLWRLRAGRPSGFIEPCLPSIARKPPTGPQWLHEIKHDGYRHGGRVRLFTRRGFEWSDRYPRIVEANGRAEMAEPSRGWSVVERDAWGEVLAIADATAPFSVHRD